MYLAYEKASNGGCMQIMDLQAPLLPGSHKLADKFGVLKVWSVAFIMRQSCTSQGVSSLFAWAILLVPFHHCLTRQAHPSSSLAGTRNCTLHSILIISLPSPLPSLITNQTALVTYYFIIEYRLQTLFVWCLIMSQLLNQFYRQCLTKLSYSIAWKHQEEWLCYSIYLHLNFAWIRE